VATAADAISSREHLATAETDRMVTLKAIVLYRYCCSIYSITLSREWWCDVMLLYDDMHNLMMSLGSYKRCENFDVVPSGCNTPMVTPTFVRAHDRRAVRQTVFTFQSRKILNLA
jgi:hypothetical protein